MRWDWPAPNDYIAWMFLDDLCGLLDTISNAPAAVLERMTYKDRQVMVRDNVDLNSDRKHSDR